MKTKSGVKTEKNFYRPRATYNDASPLPRQFLGPPLCFHPRKPLHSLSRKTSALHSRKPLHLLSSKKSPGVSSGGFLVFQFFIQNLSEKAYASSSRLLRFARKIRMYRAEMPSIPV